MPDLVPATSAKPAPDVMSFLLLVAVLALLVCTIYLVYLGCTLFGADVFFRAIYSPEQLPEVAARIIGF
ncbi:MAG: hypothetical protein GWP14_05570 [Actinobacteria bacterium]|nr:hypothetical protein [Actinomycetota bacterium]